MEIPNWILKYEWHGDGITQYVAADGNLVDSYLQAKEFLTSDEALEFAFAVGLRGSGGGAEPFQVTEYAIKNHLL